MSMTPEEVFNQNVWWVLSKIMEESLATKSGDYVPYNYSIVIGPGLPSEDRQRNILFKLEEWGALKVIDDPFDSRADGDASFYLDLNPTKFSEVYSKYQQLCQPKNISANTTQVSGAIQGKESTKSQTGTSPQIILADLNSKFQELIQEKDDKTFYLKVASYGKYLLDESVLQLLVSKLLKDSEDDVEKYKSAMESFYSKWQELAQDLITEAMKAGVIDDPKQPFISQISVITKKLKEVPSPDDDYLNWYYIPYTELIRRFKEAGKIDLVRAEHFVDGSKESLLLDSDYRVAQEEFEKFKLIRETKVWWAHYQVMRLTHGVLDLEDRDSYFGSDSTVDTIYEYEFKEIARGKIDTIIIKRPKFNEWVTRLHSYLVPRLSSVSKANSVLNPDLENSASSIPISMKLFFYPDDGIAAYRGADYPFTKGKTNAFLKLLSKNKNTPYGVNDIKSKCNPSISVDRHRFKSEKDIRDTLSYIRSMLKVKKGEYFPIVKHDTGWVWIEK